MTRVFTAIAVFLTFPGIACEIPDRGRNIDLIMDVELRDSGTLDVPLSGDCVSNPVAIISNKFEIQVDRNVLFNIYKLAYPHHSTRNRTGRMEALVIDGSVTAIQETFNSKSRRRDRNFQRALNTSIFLAVRHGCAKVKKVEAKTFLDFVEAEFEKDGNVNFSNIRDENGALIIQRFVSIEN